MSKRKRRTTNDVRKLLEKHGCELLSEEYKNLNVKMLIRCSCGEVFEKALVIMNRSGLYMCNKCVKEYETRKQMTPYNILKDKISKLGYELLTEEKDYFGQSKKCKLKCPNNHVYEQIPNDLLQGHKCKKCATEEVVSKFRLSYDDVKHNLEKWGFTLLSKEYKSNGDKLEVKCNKCGCVFYPSYGNLQQGTRCPDCYKKEKGKDSLIPYKKRLEYVRSFGFDILTPKEEYVNGYQKIKLKCDEGHIYHGRIYDFVAGNRCPICRKSKGEVKISKILDDKHINYIEQYRINDCRLYRPLPFDFYLPDYNILIEFDGKQHYVIESFGKDLDTFISIKIRDTIKNIYCDKNNLNLIRIPYWEINNIEEILNNKIINKSNNHE